MLFSDGKELPVIDGAVLAERSLRAGVPEEASSAMKAAAARRRAKRALVCVTSRP
jgi:hypothetical protein